MVAVFSARLPAITKTLCSPVNNKNFDDFVDRLNQGHFNSWQQKGIRFHPAYFKNRQVWFGNMMNVFSVFKLVEKTAVNRQS